MTHFSELDTPAVLIDLDRAEANLKKAQDAADKAGIALRPHIKTHKLPFFAQKQVALGAVGRSSPMPAIASASLSNATPAWDAVASNRPLPHLTSPARSSLRRASTLPA